MDYPYVHIDIYFPNSMFVKMAMENLLRKGTKIVVEKLDQKDRKI